MLTWRLHRSGIEAFTSLSAVSVSTQLPASKSTARWDSNVVCVSCLAPVRYATSLHPTADAYSCFDELWRMERALGSAEVDATALSAPPVWPLTVTVFMSCLVRFRSMLAMSILRLQSATCRAQTKATEHFDSHASIDADQAVLAQERGCKGMYERTTSVAQRRLLLLTTALQPSTVQHLVYLLLQLRHIVLQPDVVHD